MHNKGGAPVAFVEYADVRCAAQALISLQGTYLLSSDRGGVRIEYARNKMAETGSNSGGSPTSGSSSSSLMSGNGHQEHKYNFHSATEVEAAKMSHNANMAANSALSQAVQGAPLHALGLYGHYIWLGKTCFFYLGGPIDNIRAGKGNSLFFSSQVRHDGGGGRTKVWTRHMVALLLWITHYIRNGREACLL